MRKLAREAVIFALLGTLIASIWFCVQETRNFRRAETERALSDASNAATSDDPAYKILFAAQNVEKSTRADAWRIFWESKDLDEFTRHLTQLNLPQSVKADLRRAKARCFPDDWINVPSNRRKNESASPGNRITASDEHGNPARASNEPAWLIPAYCTESQLPAGLTPLDSGNAKESSDSVRWPEPRATQLQALIHTVPSELLMGLIVGFPGGLGVWVFYRLVRFAILG